MPAIPHLQEPLRDGVVVLRPYAERDIPEILIAYQDSPTMHEALGERRPPSGAELGRAAEEAEAARQAGHSFALTILAPGSDDCCGQVRVRHVDWDARTAELDVWVAPQARNRGFARSAVRLATDWLGKNCGLEATCLASGA